MGDRVKNVRYGGRDVSWSKPPTLLIKMMCNPQKSILCVIEHYIFEGNIVFYIVERPIKKGL